MKRLFLFILTCLLGAAPAMAEPLTLDGAVQKALKVNTTYLNAQLALDRAQNSLSPWVNWKGISVSATQKQASENGPQPASTTTTLGLNLPLFDQLGASASVDQEQNAQVSVTANPLAHSDTATQARIAYDKALLAAAQARLSLETAVRKSYLAQASAQAQLDVAVQKTVLKETAYNDAKARFDKGKVTLAEVRTALQDWVEARTAQTTAERNQLKAGSELAALLQTEAVDVAGIDSASVEAAVKALGELNTAVLGTSSTVKTQALEVEAQQAKADAVWLLDPGLAVSGNAQIPAAGDLTWSASVTLTLSLGDWQGSDKSLAERSAALARQTLEAQKAAVRSNEAQALLAIQSAADSVETRSLALAQAQELQTETNLLAKAGEATALEVEEAKLGVTAAQIDLFGAWSDLYGARLDLLVIRS